MGTWNGEYYVSMSLISHQGVQIGDVCVVGNGLHEAIPLRT